jgi:hypothetical protein
MDFWDIRFFFEDLKDFVLEEVQDVVEYVADKLSDIIKDVTYAVLKKLALELLSCIF